MRRRIMIVLLISGVAGAMLLGAAGLTRAGDPQGATGRGPYSASEMIGGYHSDGIMGGAWQQDVPASKPLTIQRAQQQVQLYIKQFGNSRLAIDEIMEFQRNFYAVVMDKTTGHGAFEVLVNKWTGLVFPEYGPAMMWNTKYGMMRGGMMGYGYPSGPMTISPSRARAIARRWLSRNRPRTTIDMLHQFPGYYTVHYARNGVIAGMFSVNGYSGRVWYHSWHGKFIRMMTLNG